MTPPSPAAARARTGSRLDDVVPSRAEQGPEPVALTATQQHDLVDLWTTLLADVYVHYGQKRALYGYDPLRALAALRREIPLLDSAGFLRALSRIVNRLRDQHTQLFVGAPGADPYVAALPFLVESFGPYTAPTFLVTKTTDGVPDPAFVPGVRLITWNAVPFTRAVDQFADTLTGGRPDARRARALETLTQRPLAYLPPPDELWVDVGYRHPEDPADDPDRTARFEWRAIRPESAATADDRVETRTRRGIDVVGETARRARKLLFATDLWEADRRAAAPQAKGSGWLRTSFADALAARPVTTSHGTFGYLRIWTFDVRHPARFADEVARLLRRLPAAGLVVDLRSNPGGVVDAAERLFQLFTDRRIEPARFACRATPAMADIAEADGNGADLADWAGSLRTALDLGEEFSQHLPLADPELCNGAERAYRGHVVAVVDANTYSCGDLFAAGIVDHGIGRVVAVGAATGGGGANVWTGDDVQYAYHAAHRTLPPLPPGIGFALAVRRMVRSGAAAGLAIEDVGVAGEERYDMTERDVVGGNRDLLEHCTALLASS
ncbi:S41 family peptidase [Krasilnikoviella flava]|uniref:Peptidase family S41 n=1 Tax=Krasilnikoviella flava TaxID=526729 RepID=A0A1T5L7L5_9MICO|nr:S41 family peptidase [Krasilnikoviella flava]SKC72017.1 Peptidase family S41 [Krasilnikoviella flava]